MASPGSSIRSAARATSSALRSLPIRWRLAGGSALLTGVILCGFAVIVGALTTQRIRSDFNRQVASSADDLQRQLVVRYNPYTDELKFPRGENPDLTDYAAGKDAAIRVVYGDGTLIERSRNAPYLGQPLNDRTTYAGYVVETRPVPIDGLNTTVSIQYARRLTDVTATNQRVKLFLALGVLGGTALALLAGLATARRAMSPIARLTETARRIERTRDPTVRLPEPEAEDEVAELSRTLEGMLLALDDARSDTESALARQREFVADASHELRTPLTSVLANLELLVDELEGESREAAASALRSSQRMRRLVADLLLLARADAGRASAPASLVDLSEIVADVAAELGPIAPDHSIQLRLEPVPVLGVRDELHRLALNLMENAVRHTEVGIPVYAGVRRDGGELELTVEDEGPGVPAAIADRVFERFVRGEADRGSSSGLGLAIVRAVAEGHGGSVRLEQTARRGARFVVRLPAADGGAPTPPQPPQTRSPAATTGA